MTMNIKLKMKNRSHRYKTWTKIYQISNVSQYNDGYMYYATPK